MDDLYGNIFMTTTLTNLNTKLAENIDPKNQRQGPFQNLISYGTDERTMETSLL